MGNHLIKSTSLEKTQSPVSGFCYVRNRARDTVSIMSCSTSNKFPIPVLGTTPILMQEGEPLGSGVLR